MIAILKYNAGNVRSVMHALNRLNVEFVWTDQKKKLREADKVIIPGVGEAGSAMAYLRDRNLDKLIVKLEQPVLGICLGLQILCSHSEEKDTECLGIFPEQVKKFTGPSKVPHVGWNTITDADPRLFGKKSDGSHFYFVHSYYAELGDSTAATGDYDVPFSAAMNKDNFWATQFHPEKSAKDGAALLKRFVEI